ncbi:MAG: formylglycine-generating enzyme family protein [Blastocatellia bacterium]|nr:formylglycine-generating enzyme family protein [Blastocatellia bacterium]
MQTQSSKKYLLILTLLFVILLQLNYQRVYSFIFINPEKKIGLGSNYGTQAPGSDYLLPEMVRIAGGSFKMGSEHGEADEQPVHLEEIKDFEIGRFEVTNAQWRSYCDAVGKNYPPNSKFSKNYFLENPNHPVVNVSWDEAQDYCRWLSQVGGKQYRLPTEAEWEYAASDSEVGRFNNNRGGASTAVVGSYDPNRYQLYDMLGNVWEWCQDNYTSSYSVKNQPERRPRKVLRGGSWGDPKILCTASNRIHFEPKYRYRFYGLRVAATP